MNDKKKLGKGLDALLSSGSSQMMASLLGGRPRETARLSANVDDTTPDRDGDLKNIPVELIQRGKYQPRTDMHEEALEELAASIKTQGVMQPIVVRPISSNKYEIIAGERRWRATQMACLDTIPAIVKPVGDEAAIAMALIENIQRENLNPIEEAMALKRLQDEFELTQQEVADAVGKSRVTVTNLIRLIGLHISVRRMLEHGDLEMGHARALLALPDEEQTSAARMVSGKGLSVRQTEALVRRLTSGSGAVQSKQVSNPDIKNLENKLAEKLGAKVMIQHTAKGKGKVVVRYNSLDELDGILGHIN
ncbi:MAG: chromosome partitioning protein ParB [Gammaproteobacteria bacterium]|nr:chromosome partitioning protein ParB [Gammaproteobacteria bacterium]